MSAPKPTKNPNNRKYLVVFFASLFAVLLLLITALVAVIRPDPGPPPPAVRPVRAKTTRTEVPESQPEVPVAADCTVQVRVTDAQRTPVEDARVQLIIRLNPFKEDTETVSGRTTEAGLVRLESPCGIATLKVLAEGFAPYRRNDVDLMVLTQVDAELVEGVRIEGFVLDVSSGDPIEGARVTSENHSVTSGPSGEWVIRADPASLRAIRANAPGYRPLREGLRVEPGEKGPIFIDLLMEPSREVAVWCLGLPNDSCATISPLMCTQPLLPMGEPCRVEDPDTYCDCPQGEVAIRGGGSAVRVPAEANEAVLDLRFSGGGITGRLVQAELPAPCTLNAIRLPTGYEDIPGGLAAGQTGKVGENGHFQFFSLKPGRWQVHATCPRGLRIIDAGLISDAVIDLGTVDIDEGGRIEGQVISGTTEEGAPNQSVVALPVGSEGEGLATAISGMEGRFSLEGVRDGTYEVFLATRPYETERVDVVHGKSPDIVLYTGDAGLLEEQAFELKTDENGELQVSSVDPEGGAAQAGLQPGDTITGVQIGGVDLGSVLPGYEAEVLDLVLDHYNGPGVGLQVERGESLVIIDLSEPPPPDTP
jgi:hypothetical protein